MGMKIVLNIPLVGSAPVHLLHQGISNISKDSVQPTSKCALPPSCNYTLCNSAESSFTSAFRDFTEAN